MDNFIISLTAFFVTFALAAAAIAAKITEGR
jgi:hypothetical protein